MGALPSREMKASVRSVEQIIGYRFKNKRLLEKALTHSSPPSPGADSVSYERLEFLGDSVISLAISSYFFNEYPELNPDKLNELLEANAGNEKLARVAVRHGLYHYVIRHNVDSLDDQVRKFAEAVREEDDKDVYHGTTEAPEAPDILADIVESISAAVYCDVDFDLKRVWMILKGLLEPIGRIEDVEKHPVTKLYSLCQKQGKQVHIDYSRDGSKFVSSVGIDGRFVASASADQKKTAKRNAAKSALLKLSQSRPNDVATGVNEVFEIEGAKHKFREVSQKKRWTKSIFFNFFLFVLIMWFLNPFSLHPLTSITCALLVLKLFSKF